MSDLRGLIIWFSVYKAIILIMKQSLELEQDNVISLKYGSSRCTCPGRDIPLQWRHNGPDSVSNHQPHDCFLNCLFRRRSKETSKLCVTGLCAGNSPGTGKFPAQMASYAENVSIWWRHHAIFFFLQMFLQGHMLAILVRRPYISPLRRHWSPDMSSDI